MFVSLKKVLAFEQETMKFSTIFSFFSSLLILAEDQIEEIKKQCFPVIFRSVFTDQLSYRDTYHMIHAIGLLKLFLLVATVQECKLNIEDVLHGENLNKLFGLNGLINRYFKFFNGSKRIFNNKKVFWKIKNGKLNMVFCVLA